MKWLAGIPSRSERKLEGHHRRTRDAGLERADVGLGVAVPGELLLGQPGAVPRLADAEADAQREIAVAARRLGHRPSCVAWPAVYTRLASLT